MYGNPQIQKLGLASPFAAGWYQNAGFVADPKSVNGLGGLWDALSITIPNSGEGADALKNFSVIASGTLAGPGNWTFSIPICEPLPALAPGIASTLVYGPESFYWVGTVPGQLVLTPEPGYAGNEPQYLPKPSATSGSVAVTTQTSFVFEADVAVSAGALSGTWTLTLDNVQVATGNLNNLPTNSSQPFAAYFQIAQKPSGASISGVTLAVSVAGFSGSVLTLNL